MRQTRIETKPIENSIQPMRQTRIETKPIENSRKNEKRNESN